MKLREFLFDLFGKTQEQRWDAASPLGKNIYRCNGCNIFSDR